MLIYFYRWMDGSPVVFQMWEKSQPNFLNNDEHCVAMSSVTGAYLQCTLPLMVLK